jgi:hypothetical protein
VSSFFKCYGKFAGLTSSRYTPAGIELKEFIVATYTKLAWKEPFYSNILIKAYEKTANDLDNLKTGDLITVEGIIESVGKKGNTKINLIAKLIKKE